MFKYVYPEAGVLTDILHPDSQLQGQYKIAGLEIWENFRVVTYMIN